MSGQVSFRRILWGLLAASIVALVIHLSWNTEYVYTYRMHFFRAHDVLKLDLRELTAISESQLEKRYPLNWYCGSDISEFGDRFCADELKGWNNLPAVDTLFWFKNGQLVQARINIPPWAHDRLIQHLQSTYGKPSDYSSRINGENLVRAAFAIYLGVPADSINKAVGDLGIWHLDSGAWITTNLRKDSNPIRWTTVLWTGPEKVAALTKAVNSK